jgi:hypothetical protein
MSNKKSDRETTVAIVAAVLFFLAWFGLMRYVLPHFGVYT